MLAGRVQQEFDTRSGAEGVQLQGLHLPAPAGVAGGEKNVAAATQPWEQMLGEIGGRAFGISIVEDE